MLIGCIARTICYPALVYAIIDAHNELNDSYHLKNIFKASPTMEDLEFKVVQRVPLLICQPVHFCAYTIGLAGQKIQLVTVFTV